jgi:hypothetical protein
MRHKFENGGPQWWQASGQHVDSMKDVYGILDSPPWLPWTWMSWQLYTHRQIHPHRWQADQMHSCKSQVVVYFRSEHALGVFRELSAFRGAICAMAFWNRGSFGHIKAHNAVAQAPFDDLHEACSGDGWNCVLISECGPARRRFHHACQHGQKQDRLRSSLQRDKHLLTTRNKNVSNAWKITRSPGKCSPVPLTQACTCLQTQESHDSHSLPFQRKQRETPCVFQSMFYSGGPRPRSMSCMRPGMNPGQGPSIDRDFTQVRQTDTFCGVPWKFTPTKASWWQLNR